MWHEKKFRSLLFFVPHLFGHLDFPSLPPPPFICPWVSEDVIKRTVVVVLVASLRSLNCGFRFSLRFSAQNEHFSYPRKTVSLTVVREEIKNEKDEKKKET